MMRNFSTTKKLTSCFMPVFQKTSIRFFKQFPTVMHSGKMYIRHLFCYGQWKVDQFLQIFFSFIQTQCIKAQHFSFYSPTLYCAKNNIDVHSTGKCIFRNNDFCRQVFQTMPVIFNCICKYRVWVTFCHIYFL